MATTTTPAKAAPVAPAKATTPATTTPASTAPTRYIALLATSNPKKPGSASAARFALYQHGQTVAAYRAAVIAAGQPGRLAAADLLWDVKHGFITLHTTAPAKA